MQGSAALTQPLHTAPHSLSCFKLTLCNCWNWHSQCHTLCHILCYTLTLFATNCFKLPHVLPYDLPHDEDVGLQLNPHQPHSDTHVGQVRVHHTAIYTDMLLHCLNACIVPCTHLCCAQKQALNTSCLCPTFKKHFKSKAGPSFWASDKLHCSTFDKLWWQGAHWGWQIGEWEKKEQMCTSERATIFRHASTFANKVFIFNPHKYRSCLPAIEKGVLCLLPIPYCL